jgi:hypothetical protein
MAHLVGDNRQDEKSSDHDLLQVRFDAPTVDWVARQIAEAFPWQETPQHLLRDRDALYGHVVRQRLAVISIRDRSVTARSPWQNGLSNASSARFADECVNHVIALGKGHLRKSLKLYADDHDRLRTYLSFD